MSDSGAGDDDFLDGCCDLDFDMGPEVTDDLTPWVVLFATCLDGDLQVADEQALARRAAEWIELFGERVA